MSKKCLFCGSVLDDEALFCDDCGKKQEAMVQNEVTMKEQAPPLGAQTYYNERPSVQSMPGSFASAPMQAKPKDNSTVFAWVGFALGIASYVLFFPLMLPTAITGTVGLVFSIMGVRSSKKGIAIVSIVLNAIALLIFSLFITIILLAE